MNGLAHKELKTENRIRRNCPWLLFALLVAFPSFEANAQWSHHQGIYAVSEPPNLGILQDSIRFYIKSGTYEKGIAQVIDSAKSFVEPRYRDAKNPAVVLDIDETSLSNVQFEYRYGFGFETSLWNAWVKKASASAIEPTLKFAKWAAQKKEKQRAGQI
ncbi:MAG: HAD family acid phosphatase, partial [Bacteroidetes bacterium]|nr:HAD family acid phosphatase [Bacteroidota bacterium]